MKLIDTIKESTTTYLLSAVLGLTGLIIGSLYSEIIPIVSQKVLEEVSKLVLLRLLLLATILCGISWFLSLAIYLKYRRKMIPKAGVLWDKKKEAYCPSCEIPLSEYWEDPSSSSPTYEFTCMKCNSHIRLSHEGKPLPMKDVQKLL